MHPILQLDRAGWTYNLAHDYAILTHDMGRVLRLELIAQGGIISEEDTRRRLLVFPGIWSLYDLSGSWGAMWALIETAAGAAAIQRFETMYQYVEQVQVVMNYPNRISVKRGQGEPLWTFGDYDAVPLSGMGTSPLGPHEASVKEALARVHDVSVPVLYSFLGRIGQWAPDGRCVWDRKTTGHERLALLSSIQATGLIPPP